MPRPRPRTRDELIEHLRDRRRFAAAEIGPAVDRVTIIDRVLADAAAGRPINPDDLEHLDVDDWMAAS